MEKRFGLLMPNPICTRDSEATEETPACGHIRGRDRSKAQSRYLCAFLPYPSIYLCGESFSRFIVFTADRVPDLTDESCGTNVALH